MSQGVRLHVWGERACFSRPELKVERVSYDAMTPSAARGILEAVHWKPAIRWVVERIHVLKPIRHEALRRNEIETKPSAKDLYSRINRGEVPSLGAADHRVQRAAIFLRDVEYVIEARFEMTDRAGEEDNPGKHADMVRRRARTGQCFKQPVLGVREFPAHFTLIADDAALPEPDGDLAGTQRLGWMLHDLAFPPPGQKDAKPTPRFFHAVMQDGRIDIPAFHGPETVS